MNGPLLFSFLVMTAMMSLFVALRQVVARSKDPVEARLEQYGLTPAEVLVDASDYLPQRRSWPGVNRLLNGLGVGPRLATDLARADLSLTAAEYGLIILGVGALGFVLGTLRLNVGVGLFMGVVFGYIPVLYLRFRVGRRQRAFTEQLPEILTLLVGGLRGGYGISQALQVVVERLPPPASVEFARASRALELGLPLQQALSDMTERVGSDDLDLVVTAINVQHELGGNLAQTLDTIGETIRGRIRLKREVRVLTSHQRLTSYVLAGVPVGLAILLFMMNPTHMSKLFAPDPSWVRCLPIGAVLLMAVGFLIIRKIADIEV